MIRKITSALGGSLRSEYGLTGVETAIILIAFVTVASVLAYSVLAAGVFSAEKGKSAIYGGLASAEGSMQVQGSVLGLSPNQSELEQVVLTVGLALSDASIGMNSVVINYYDDTTHSENLTFTSVLSGGSTERGSANMMEADEQFVITITIPGAVNAGTYDQFVIQIIPPAGATLTLERTLPGALEGVMDLR